MQITFSKAALPKTGAIVIPCMEGKFETKTFKSVDKTTKGALARAVKAGDFSGKSGQVVTISGPAGYSNGHIVLVGAGKDTDFTVHKAEELGGRAFAKVIGLRERAVLFVMEHFESDALSADKIAAHIAFGARLRSYRFDQYRTTQEKREKQIIAKIALYGADVGAKAAYQDLSALGDGIFLTRDLVSEPPNVLYPESFAERCRELEELGVKVKILGEKEMQKLGMGSLLGVGQGSVRDSRLVAMEWSGGEKDEKPVCFVGKGVTFDTGGISIKPANGMWDMKWDMGGAGAVTGARHCRA